jgi:CheY-like chemotaxis protein
MSDKKRILLVDDEIKVALVLARGLRTLGENYHIDTANNGPDALEKLAQSHYDLMVTDYKMPRMSGFELAEKANQIAPHTKIVMMTAHGTDELRKNVKSSYFIGYIEKPFTLAHLRRMVKQSMSVKIKAPSPQEEKKEAFDSELEAAIQNHLANLQRNANALCVLLLSTNGYPIEIVGQSTDLDIYSLGALVAANCSLFKSNYHEGPNYNVYSYDVNGRLFLAVVFGTQIKPGIIWFYTKQTADLISPLTEKQTYMQDKTQHDLAEDLSLEFVNELSQALDNAFIDPYLSEELQALVAQENTPTTPKKTIGFEDALEAGLIPEHIIDKEKKLQQK